MSNSPNPQNMNQALAPEWVALAKIGKVFYWMYLLIVFSLLFILPITLIGSFIGATKLMDDPKAMFETYPIFSLVYILGTIILLLFSVFVWIQSLIRFWATPLFPGRARCYVIISTITFLTWLCQLILQYVNPEISKYINFPILILYFITFFLFMWYVALLASSVGSKHAQRSFNWLAFGVWLLFLLVIFSDFFIQIQIIGFIVVICLLISSIIMFVSFLNIMGCLAEDIPAFIESHHQEIHENENQHQEKSQPIQEETN